MIQSRNTLQKLEQRLPGLTTELITCSSPGDRDKKTDLLVSDPDFFTRDLDDAVLSGELDAALHSAKDLPYPVRDGLDWIWLPWRANPHDAVVTNLKGNLDELEAPIIGVSSDRRIAYAKERWPNAILKPLRGTIEERLQQMDAGDFDILIMAAAALVRLDLKSRIREMISLKKLPVPHGQGFIALTFRAGDPRFEQLRLLFASPVIFAGSGPGDPKLATQATIDALRQCQVCLYDSLAPVELLKELPDRAQAIYVGKRVNQHSHHQSEINELLAEYARQGKRVVRLKGGDCGVFGRLAEEVETLNALNLPYEVLPGITSLQAATTGTGLLMTRRGMARGFSVMTCRREGEKGFFFVDEAEQSRLPRIYFMGTMQLQQITDSLQNEGWKPETPTAVVFNASLPNQSVISGKLAEIHDLCGDRNGREPGLILVGETFDPQFLYPKPGLLANQRILITGSETLQQTGAAAAKRYQAQAISLPMIELVSKSPDFTSFFEKFFDWLVVSSPSAGRLLLKDLKEQQVDLRKLPKLVVCGEGTASVFRGAGLYPEAITPSKFSAEGIFDLAKETFKPGEKVLRLRSDLAGPSLAENLRTLGVEVTDLVSYHNESIEAGDLPEFDAVVFASSSAIRAYHDQFGLAGLADKTIALIGQPTRKTLFELAPDLAEQSVLASEATITDCIDALAAHFLVWNG